MPDEGELDAISLSKCFGHKYACVSLPNGAQSAVKAVKANFDYLNGFDEVVICTDMDEAGQNAARAIAEVLPVGKAKIARLPCKDANEALVEGKVRNSSTPFIRLHHSDLTASSLRKTTGM